MVVGRLEHLFDAFRITHGENAEMVGRPPIDAINAVQRRRCVCIELVAA
jgi:hypothetical protein